MERNNEHVDDLIIQLFCGDLDEGSLAELRAWIAKSSENEKYFQEKQEIWFSAVDSTQLGKYNTQEAYHKFLRNIALAKKESEIEESGYKPILRKWMSYAAMVAVVVTIAFFASLWGEHTVRDAFAEIQVEAPYGSRTKALLPDGTVVWLNSGSKLSYSQGYGLNDRTVKMEGEGYFFVTHDEKLPFIVSSDDLQIKVLGTKFNFRDYPDDKEAEVMLEQGSVRLENLQKEHKYQIMVPGQKVKLDKNTGKFVTENCDVSCISQWSHGLIVFNDATLDEIAKRIERSYNVKVQINNEAIKAYQFNGDFVRQEQSLKEVLEALAATGKMHYRIEDRIVTIY